MHKILNEVSIRGDACHVYEWCLRVERWPEIFPAVLEVTAQDVGENAVLMHMTTCSDLGVSSIRSLRRYEPERHRIDFELLTVPDQVAAMNGHWAVEQNGAGVRLEVVHWVTVAPGVPLQERDAALQRIQSSVHKNTQQALLEIKRLVETVSAGGANA
jgi:aromatase